MEARTMVAGWRDGVEMLEGGGELAKTQGAKCCTCLTTYDSGFRLNVSPPVSGYGAPSSSMQ